MADQWQYLFITVSTDDIGARELSKLGGQGWRAIHTLPARQPPGGGPPGPSATLLMERLVQEGGKQ
jgi:hypothetical protein